MTKKANSQECIYFGRKLSNIICDDIKVSLGYVVIGSDNDDEIYFDIEANVYKENDRTLKERVKITAICDDENGHCVDIDLEDVLRFAAKYCRGIYDRVGIEQEESK